MGSTMERSSTAPVAAPGRRGYREVVAGRDEDDVVLGGLVEDLTKDGAQPEPSTTTFLRPVPVVAGTSATAAEEGGVGDGRAGGGGDATHGLDASALVEARAGEGDARGKRGGARGDDIAALAVDGSRSLHRGRRGASVTLGVVSGGAATKARDWGGVSALATGSAS